MGWGGASTGLVRLARERGLDQARVDDGRALAVGLDVVLDRVGFAQAVGRRGEIRRELEPRGVAERERILLVLLGHVDREADQGL